MVVAQIIRENLLERGARIIDLTSNDYQKAINDIAALGLSSGVIYDALQTTAAQKVGVDRLFTFNVKHFLQIWPAGTGIIVAP